MRGVAFLSFALMRQLSKQPAQAGSAHPVFEIALETDKVVDAVQQALHAGAILVKAASEMPWGQAIAYVSDNNGILIEVCSPVSAG